MASLKQSPPAVREETTPAHRCTDCGKPGATLRRDDAADVEHWWHPKCWAAFRAWLSGKAP